MKPVFKIFIALIVLVFILALVGALTGSDKPTQEIEQLDTSESAKPQATSEPVNPQTTIDKLWVALDKGVGTRSGYDISYDSSLKKAALTFYSSTFWDEDSLVEDSYTALVKFGREAFEVGGVGMLEVIYKTDFTDPYGNKSQNVAVRIVMDKENFGKFNWGNLKYLPVSRQIEAASEIYYIHPAVGKNIVEEELILSF